MLGGIKKWVQSVGGTVRRWAVNEYRSRPLRFALSVIGVGLVAALTVHLYVPAPHVSASTNSCTSNVSSGNWNVAGSWSNCGGTTPQSTDLVEITNGDTITDNVSSTTVTQLTIDSGGTLVISGTNTLTIDGNYYNGSAWASGWTNNGTFTANQSTVSMIHPYDYPAAFLSGTMTGSSAFYNLKLNDDETVMIAPFVVGANMAITNNLAIGTDGFAHGTFVSDTHTITGNSTGTFAISQYVTLDIASYPTGFTTAHTTLDPASTVVYTAGGTISNTPTYGNLYLNPSSSSYTLTLAGNTTVAGYLEIYNDTLDTSGYNTTVAGNYENFGTFTAETGTVILDGGGANTQTLSGTLSGSSAFYNLTIQNGSGYNTALLAAAMTVTNNLSMTCFSDWCPTLDDGTYQITGNSTGTFTMGGNDDYADTGSNISLMLRGTTTFPTGFTRAHTTFDATSQVVYGYSTTGGVSETVSSVPIYGTLGIGYVGTNITASLSGDTTVTGNLNIQNPLDVTSSNYNLTVAGNFSDPNNHFTARNGTVTLDGNGTVTPSGYVYQSVQEATFYNLVDANTSGTAPTDCELTSFTPGIIFSVSTTVSHTFTIAAGASAEYNSGSTYTFANVNWAGSSSAPIYFRNSATSGSYLLNISGTQTVSGVNVSRSDASGSSSAITDNAGTDCGNNTNWLFPIPNNPSALTQTAAGTTIATGGTTDETAVKFGGTVSDTGPSATLQLCAEVEPIGTTFTNTATSCGTAVSYTGTPLAASVTLTGLTPGTDYHWQAQVKDGNGTASSWVAYGANAETDADFTVIAPASSSSSSDSTATSAPKTAVTVPPAASTTPSAPAALTPATPENTPAATANLPTPQTTAAPSRSTLVAAAAAVTGTLVVLFFVIRLLISRRAG